MDCFHLMISPPRRSPASSGIAREPTALVARIQASISLLSETHSRMHHRRSSGTTFRLNQGFSLNDRTLRIKVVLGRLSPRSASGEPVLTQFRELSLSNGFLWCHATRFDPSPWIAVAIKRFRRTRMVLTPKKGLCLPYRFSHPRPSRR